ncbi:hypothetical protein RN347_06355 [Halomonas sp. PAMB 3264]|uniref:hypothetical protein n=1 Tax=Halomonas sp. PAMB 3264 TaxID=3075222 RepID=UPI0028978984|nr:hypothetical protein [Halomonas sp. PAMB 3264]WNL43516.1 hypothetical protein RN347_06355 [Halomonas sp. PAMB 3264]
MPRLVKTTMEIGLQAQRDILFLTFKNERHDDDIFGTHWEEHQERQHVVAWLEANDIPWDPCVHVRPGMTPDLYRGAIYLAVAPDEDSPTYQKVLSFLEDETGECRFPSVDFWLYRLETIKKHNRMA